MSDDSSAGSDSRSSAKSKSAKPRTTRAPRGSRTPRGPKSKRGESTLVTGELPLGAPEAEPTPAPRHETPAPEAPAARERDPEIAPPAAREYRESRDERAEREDRPEREDRGERDDRESTRQHEAPAPAETPQAPERAEPRDAGQPAGDERSENRERSDERDDRGGGSQQGGGEQPRFQGGGHGGGGGGFHGDRGDRGDFGFRKKFKKDKHKGGKFFQPGQQGGGGGGGGQGGGQGGGGGGGGGQGPRPQPWKQPAPLAESQYGVLPDPMKFVNPDELATRAAEIAGEGEPLFLDEVAKATHHELLAALRIREIPVSGNPGRQQMLNDLYKWAATNRRLILDRGLLDLAAEGHGFVVHTSSNYRLLPDSTFVPASLIRKYGLKRGHELEVQTAAPAEGERCPAALVVRTVMGGSPDEIARVVPFEDLVPYYPTNRIFLEVGSTEAPSKVDVSMRCVDILTPIGLGQRGLIVAPPRTGKTILLQGLANSVATNHPEARLIVLLVDERPEEVTDFRRNTKGEVISSTFDEAPESHVHAAEMVSEKAKRLVEKGEHVVILLDSITRLGRAYNALASNSGKIMSGGLEATALQKPKRFFGAARNIEGGGSLTVMGTALIDTNSRMDDIIFEEFKGTGNMELHLDRDLVNKRIFPAINFERSGTRKEELLYHPDELQKIYGLRRIMLGVPAFEAMEMLIQRLKKTRSNAEFLLSLSAR